MNIFKSLTDMFNPVPKMDSNTFFVWEPSSKNHAEVVPGYVKYLRDLGYNVSVLMSPDRIKEGLFSRYKDENVFLNKLSRKNVIKFFLNNGLGEAKGLIITTEGRINPDEINLLPHQKIFTVLHCVSERYEDGTLTDKHITLAKINYKDAKTTMINPHYFGEVTVNPKNDVTRFIVIGTLKSKRRNTNLLVDTVKKLHDEGYNNFKITVIGKGKLSHLPKELRKYFDICGRVSFDRMYEEMEKADFFLPLLDPERPNHEGYITVGTSGSFQLIYGFLKPCLIEKKFTAINDFSDKNSIVYSTNSGLLDAMKKAIDLSKNDYKIMQDNLAESVKHLYDISLNNLKNLIGD